MIDIKFIMENRKEIEQNLKKRAKYKINLDEIILLHQKRSRVIQKLDELRHVKNESSVFLSKLDKNTMEFQSKVGELRSISTAEKELDSREKEISAELRMRLLEIPNLLDSNVPTGRNDQDNKVVKIWGNKAAITFEAQPHWDIGEKLGILDIKRATKIAGSRFVMNIGLGAALERALINFMLDVHTRKHNYTEVVPPFMANTESFIGTGQLPKFEEDLFKVKDWDYYLIPTAEVPLTNMYRNEIIPEENLPIYVTAYSPCFRSEAGSWGKDTRGMIRVHQFNKVELVKFVKPEHSEEEHKKLLADAEQIIQLLNIPYRVVLLSSGDTGFSSSITYDIELWMPGMKVYKEASSVSNFKDFQARRANIRFREKKTNRIRFVHTLNGSGLAIGRVLASLIENYQTADGQLTIPEVLKKYLP